jgi:hypothetical protein
MNEREAVHVLAVCSSYDGRKPSTVDAQTWAYELKAVDRDTAVEAVRRFYRINPDGRIRPGHVTEYVAELRKPGLAHSSRIENAAIVALDPDDPDYDRKHMQAIHDARHAAAEAPQAIPSRIALPRGERAPEDRIDRNRRGADAARAAVKPFPGGRPVEEAVPENLRKAREAAAAQKAWRRRTDPDKLGRAGAELLTQINRNRSPQRGN